MGLQLCLIIISLLNCCLCFPFGSNNSDIQLPCPDYGKIEFAKVKTMKLENFEAVVYIECEPRYELVGKHKFLCTDGQWEKLPRPRCVAKDLCLNPPDIINGVIALEGEKDSNGLYLKGTLVTYTCNDGYRLSPIEAKYRVCEKGIWTGALGKCVPTGCKAPKDIENGYYVSEKNGVIQDFDVGQRVYYSCTSGYVLKGPLVQQCIDDGSWSPRIPPFCTLEINGKFFNVFI